MFHHQIAKTLPFSTAWCQDAIFSICTRSFDWIPINLVAQSFINTHMISMCTNVDKKFEKIEAITQDTLSLHSNWSNPCIHEFFPLMREHVHAQFVPLYIIRQSINF